MKTLMITTFTLIGLFVINTAKTQTTLSSTKKKMSTNNQEFAKQVFTAIQKNDEALWISLHPTEKEFRSLLQLMLVAKMDGLTQPKIDEIMEQRKKEYFTEYKKELHDLQAEAARRGVSWANSVYQEFDNEAAYPENFPKKYLNGDIWFAGKNGYFIIEGIEAVETDNGYKLQSVRGIRQVEESY